MARIPSAYQQSRATPSASRNISTIDLSQGARAMQGLGASVNKIANEIENDRDEFERIQAEAALTLRLNKERESYKQDNDYATHSKRFYENSNKILDEVGGQIKNPRSRAIFMERAKVAAARSQAVVEDDAFAKESDFNNAKLMEDIDGLTEVAYTSPVDRDNALDLINARIATHERQGFFGANGKVKAEQMRKKITSNFAYNSIEMADPEKGREMLNGSLSKFLSTPQKDKLRQVLDNKEVDLHARGIVDDVMGQIESGQMTERQARDVIRSEYKGSERDIKIADQAIQRLKIRSNEFKQDIMQAEKQASDVAWQTFTETGKISSIPAEILKSMDGKSRYMLEKTAKSETGLKTDWDQYYGLRQMMVKDKEAFMSQNLRQYQLSNTEFKELVKIQTNEEGEIELSRTKQQMINQGAVALGINLTKARKPGAESDKLNAYSRRLDEEFNAFQATHGKPPSKKEIGEIVDGLAIEIVKDPDAWFFDGKGKAYEFEIDGIPKNMIDDLARAVQGQGQDVTEENIKALYNFMGKR